MTGNVEVSRTARLRSVTERLTVSTQPVSLRAKRLSGGGNRMLSLPSIQLHNTVSPVSIPAFYIWAIGGGLLMILEIFAPGFSLFWLGGAALITAVVLFVWPALGGAATAFLTFTGAAVILVSLGFLLRRYYDGTGSGQIVLNRSAERLIGGVYTLETAIENGQGRARVGDSTWLVQGQDLPAGHRVKVVSTESNILIVEPAS